ncbi:MAG: ectoine synthase [Granulosicoccus sp.]|nr:ectoine synthase [Granulosicoccus sp.]
MIVRTIEDLKNSGRYAEKPGSWTSARYLLKGDGMGFTVTRTSVSAGSVMEMEYKNHLEANLIVSGKGRLHDLATGDVHELSPGSMYALDKHDRHRVEALSDMSIVCVFTPALTGSETHDEQGSYPLL